MLIAGVEDVSKSFGAQSVLENASFQVSSGRKLGLIGPNGSGKTTLINILLGREEPDTGRAFVAPGASVGYVPQYVDYDDDDTINDHILSDHRRYAEALRAAEKALADTSGEALHKAMGAYQRAREEYERIDGDHFERRAKAMLDALGLTGRGGDRVGTLSGGEKNVLSLAAALLARPDFLILDEPANHLDYMGIAWLEDFLSRFKGAILIVSHNRYLLDRVTDGTLALERRRVRYYGGGYSDYQATRLTEMLAQQADYAANQKRLAQLEALVHKFEQLASAHPNHAWGKRLRARRHQLEREKARAVEKPDMGPGTMKAGFTAGRTRADIALNVKGYSRSFGNLVLFEKAELDISCGERVALVGPNGCGKTTLLRDIMDRGGWENPVLRVGPSLSVGYCAQEQEVLGHDRSVFDEICATTRIARKDATALLARFLFFGDDLQKKVSDLSGGERNRLQLARLMILQPNFLVLDEPTNHLDIPAREAVEEALGEFAGTLLVVSHDRYFLDKIASRVVEVVDRRFVSYHGNFTDFWMKKQISMPRVVGRISRRAATRARGATKAGGKEARKRANPILVAELEKRIADTERRKQTLEAQMTQAFARRDNREGHKAAKDLEKIKKDLDALYEKWASYAQ